MIYFHKRLCQPLFFCAFACVIPLSAQAYNGIYLPGYGTESAFMGGADVAVARDAFAANNNPAGMTQLAGQALDIEAVPWYVPFETHSSNSLGNRDKHKTDSYGFYGSGAYARHFENSPVAAGVALVVQGGQGWTYSGLNTVFGTRDDASALFAVVKLAPAIAWEVNDSLSLGASLGINYLAGNQELFPNTSDETTLGVPFYGFRFKDASGIGLSYKYGLQYRPAKDVTIGLTYGTQTSITMKNGSMRVNFTNSTAYPGLGVVRYDNAKMTGFRLPEELALGISFRLTPSLLISLQEKWYNWSDALNKLHIIASSPREAGAPATFSIDSSADFVDQHVLEAGFAYDYDSKTVLMGGINYANNAIPNRNLSPIFAPILELHYMLGASRKLDAEWEAAGGFEWYQPKSEKYNSPIFGSDATEHASGLVLHFSVSRRW